MQQTNLITELNKQGADAIFLVNISNIRYVSGYTGEDSFLIIIQNKGYFLTDYRYTEQAEEECRDFEVITINREFETLEQKISEIVHSHGINRLGFEKNHITYDLHQKIKRELKSCKLIATEGVVESLRYIKSDKEIGFIKKASEIADNAFNDLLPLLKPGISEMDAALELEMLIRSRGSENIAFPVILVSGQNTSRPHGTPSIKKLEKGDFITLDFGALVGGYRSDMTRTVIMGTPNEKQRKVYDIVKEAQQRGTDSVRDGVSGKEVNLEVEQVLKRYDYLGFAGKGIGHGVGLDIHEKPFIGTRCEDTLKSNCVITMEPGIYIPFWGGVRIEDTLLVTDSGCESLSQSIRDLLIL